MVLKVAVNSGAHSINNDVLFAESTVPGTSDAERAVVAVQGIGRRGW
jgi:hypothetical protein